MLNKKVISVRFYPKADADLIEWLEKLAAGEGNSSIKAMLRAGIDASLSGQAAPSFSEPSASSLDPNQLHMALDALLPRIREIVDASLASATWLRSGEDALIRDEDTPVAAQLLNGHLIGDEDD